MTTKLDRLEACDSYVEILLEGHPEMKGNIIIANI